ncbi:hypothetical protein INR49_014286 [Caranx melampygus]|nr:hypothetical protein INR49_014286 [Caranx melampygus]
MHSHTLLHAANFSTLFVCMVLKFPQIFVLMRAKSSTGVSLNSLLLELVGRLDYVILLLLILHYNGSLRQSLIYALARRGLEAPHCGEVDHRSGYEPVHVHSAASKFAQLQCLWRSKDAGQVSALSWGMATYTCMARIYTTTVTTGDMQVMVRFVVMTLLNLWVLLTVLYYQRRSSSSSKKED